MRLLLLSAGTRYHFTGSSEFFPECHWGQFGIDEMAYAFYLPGVHQVLGSAFRQGLWPQDRRIAELAADQLAC